MKRFRFAALAALLVVGAMFASTTALGAATKKTVDKSAILVQGADITTQGGGASFDAAYLGSAIVSDAAGIYMPAIYDLLIRLTPEGKLVPGLATKWATPDPNTVILTIRQGVKFQDGTPFTADAVKQAWDKIRTTPISTASHDELWNNITSIEVVGSDQVKVTLSTPKSGAFLTRIASVATGAVPSPTAVAKYGADYKFHPVGAGPYAFDSFQPGQKISLRKWNGYWDAKKSQRLGGIDIVQTSSGAPTVASLQAGQINLAKIAITDTPGLAGQTNLTTSNFTNTSSSMLLLPCTNKAPFSNADARNAISTGIDRKAVNQAAYNGTGEASELLYGKNSPYYEPSLEGKHTYSVSKAKALLEKAGVKSGTPVTMMVSANSAGADRASVVVQDSLKKIGLDANIIMSTNFVSDQQRLNPDLIMVSTDATTLQNFLGTGAITNWCKYSNPTIDSALTTIQTTADGQPAAKAPWKQIQQVLSTDSPELILSHAPVVWAHTKAVNGFEVTPFLAKPIIWNVYMTKS